MTAPRFTTLIEAQELAAHLRDPDWVVLDCRFELSNPAYGEQAYERGHIPGARYAHLDRDLSGPITPVTGRHPLPTPEKLAARLGSWGIDASVQVVAYDDATSAYAARLWWMLRWLGHGAVAVLNGGLQAWLRAGLPVETVPPTVTPRQFRPRPDPRAWVTTEQVAASLPSGDLQLVDARAADRFAGQNETIDPKAGHVPGARNHPFAANLDAEKRFLPPARLRELWGATLGDTPIERVVSMCGSGVTACHGLLALEVAGLSGARLYAGSWSEWIRDASRPIAVGPATERKAP